MSYLFLEKWVQSKHISKFYLTRRNKNVEKKLGNKKYTTTSEQN